MSSATSYQNGPKPLRLEELGISPEALARKKKNRRLLFTGMSVVLLLAFAVFAFIVSGHQKQIEEETYSQEFGILSLQGLNAKTMDTVQTGCETTIVIIRHCEKTGAGVLDDDRNEHCSYSGLERAYFLPSLFGEGGWPVPSYLYALSPKRGRHFNFREVETLVPLAEKHGLAIQSDYDSNDELAKHLFKNMASGSLCGKTALVSWKHELVGDLARKLACTDCPRFFPDVFDQVWQLKYVYDAIGTPVVLKTQAVVPSEDRRLKKKKKKKKKIRSSAIRKKSNESNKIWSVFSTVTEQNYDPLKFSAMSGDYDGTASVGGKWFATAEDETNVSEPDEGEM